MAIDHERLEPLPGRVTVWEVPPKPGTPIVTSEHTFAISWAEVNEAGMPSDCIKTKDIADSACGRITIGGQDMLSDKPPTSEPSKTIVVPYVNDSHSGTLWVAMSGEICAVFEELAALRDTKIQWREIDRQVPQTIVLETPTATYSYYLDSEGNLVEMPETRADPAKETP